jgi:hypothetical protein
MSNRLALYSTVYPGVEPFLSAWYATVRAQTDQEFDLWIALDSVDPEHILNEMGAESESVNFVSGIKGTPAQIRERAIDRLVDNYEAIVFADSDDLLYPTRIETARRQLENHDVIGCALNIIDEGGRDLGLVFGQTDGEQLDSLLPRYNIFGLSNTAYRSGVVRTCLPLGDACELFDWSLATRAWAEGANFYFDQQPQMSYRQYGANIARVLLPFTDDQVLKASGRVLGHYQCLLEGERPINGTRGTALRREYERVSIFDQTINKGGSVLIDYVDALNQKAPRYVWWWCVAHPELEYIWKN